MHRIVTEDCKSIDIKDVEQYITSSKYVVIAVNSECTDSILCLEQTQDNEYCWINNRFHITCFYNSYKKAIKDAITDGYTVKVVERLVDITIDGIKG